MIISVYFEYGCNYLSKLDAGSFIHISVSERGLK